MPHTKLLGLTVVGILVVLPSIAPAPPAGHSYASGSFALTLEGKTCGFIKSVEGGAISAEVVNVPAGASTFTKKHIGQPRYEDFTVQVGFGMDKPVYDWIAQSWTMNPPRRNGSIITADYNYQAQSERQFSNAIVAETTIPAMDGASKEPAYITVRFTPELTRFQKTEGKVTPQESAKDTQKVFVPCNFKLQIDGLDCAKVSKIDSFTVKRTTVISNVGSDHYGATETGKIEFPNLKITIPEASAQSFLDWHESFVVQGKSDESAEKNGVLTLFAANQQRVLARIKFSNLGIFRLQSDKAEANADAIKRVTAELYVERMEFEYVGGEAESGSTGTTPPAAPAKPVPSRRG